MGYEFSEAEEKLKGDEAWERQPEDRKKRLRTAQAFCNRLSKTREEQSLLEDCLPLARALFSEDLEVALTTLARIFWTIEVMVEASIDDDGSNEEFSRDIRRTLYDVDRKGDGNEVSVTIRDAVALIEQICVPALRLDPPGKDACSKPPVAA